MDGLHGVIDYPLLKKNVDVELSDEDCKKLDDIIKEIISVKNQEYPPKLEEKKICKNVHIMICVSYRQKKVMIIETEFLCV